MLARWANPGFRSRILSANLNSVSWGIEVGRTGGCAGMLAPSSRATSRTLVSEMWLVLRFVVGRARVRGIKQHYLQR